MTLSPAYPHEAPSVGAAADFAATLRAKLPQLETARLILRAPQIEDFEAYSDILMSPRALYMDGPYSRQEAWADFTSAISNWLLRGHGPWTIMRKADQTILGFVSVQMEFSDHEPELGYFLREEAEGHGFAFEAAKAARDHALHSLKLAALVSYIDPENARSRKLAEKLGARPDPIAAAKFSDHATDPILVYRHEVAA